MESNMKRQEVDCLTGEVSEIELTAAEIKAYEDKIAADTKALTDAENEAQSIANAKVAAAEKLLALGIDPKALGL